jgi:hypothetical protein
MQLSPAYCVVNLQPGVSEQKSRPASEQLVYALTPLQEPFQVQPSCVTQPAYDSRPEQGVARPVQVDVELLQVQPVTNEQVVEL